MADYTSIDIAVLDDREVTVEYRESGPTINNRPSGIFPTRVARGITGAGVELKVWLDFGTDKVKLVESLRTVADQIAATITNPLWDAYQQALQGEADEATVESLRMAWLEGA